MESNYCMRIHNLYTCMHCACAGSRVLCAGIYMYNCRSAAMACVLCHKPSFAGHRCVLHPESFNNKEQRGFFATFVNRLRD